MDSEARELLIIVATYNESENIPVLIGKVRELAVPFDTLRTPPHALGVPAHILVVDDNSPDGTGQIVEKLAEETPGCIRVLRRSGKLGYASALREGFAVGLAEGYKVIMTMDADLSHDPAKIPEIYAATEQYDVVLGSRYVAGGGTVNWPLYRRVLSRAASRLARLLAGLRAHDCTGGFRAYRSHIITEADLLSSNTEGYSFLVETLFKCQRTGASIGEVPIVFAERERGASKISKKIIFEAGWVLLKLFWWRVTRKH